MTAAVCVWVRGGRAVRVRPRRDDQVPAPSGRHARPAGLRGSAERLGARGAGAALGAGRSRPDEPLAVAPGLSAEPGGAGGAGGGSSAARRRSRAAGHHAGPGRGELGQAQLLELLRLALCARGERMPGRGQGGHVGGSGGGAQPRADPLSPPRKLWGAGGNLVARSPPRSGEGGGFSQARQSWGKG